MKNIIKLLLLLACANFAWAIPTLQLDIPGGVYDPVDQTIIATSPTFTLRALLDGTLDPARMYYVSAAIAPRADQTPAPTIGSFIFGGSVYGIASLNYGTPPVVVPDSPPSIANGNLADHGIFPTYYTERGFTFLSTQTVGAYNTADKTASPGSLYYYDFAVDVTNLASGYKLHFDLYNTTLDNQGNPTRDEFAPFSHDASSNGTHVPEGGSTMALLGVALLGAAMLRRLLPAPRAA